MASSNLAAIRAKARQIARAPSEQALTTAQLDEFINTFILQDFPEHVRLFNLHTVLEFYLTPHVALYDTLTAPATSPLFDFKNKYLSVEGPIYIAGIQGQILQSRAQFYSMYPQVTTAQRVGTGDGVNFAFSGTISGTPILQRSVLFNGADANGEAIILVDEPQNPMLGDLIVPNDTSTSYGTVNYSTGAFSFNFPVSPAAQQPVTAQYYPYQASRPLVCLFYDGVFEFRPVPDQAYKVAMSAFIRPTELFNSTDVPNLNEWWQYIACGAAKKIFENRMDLDSIQMLQPIMDEYQLLIQRRTLVQNSTQRTPTIFQYSNNNMGFPGGYFFNQF